jgi:hypothetical protein
MKSATRIARRLALMGMVVIGLAMNPVAARELCNENGSLALADGDGDGVVSRGEIQAIIDAASGVEGADQLQSLLNGLPGDVTGIRYVDCAASGDGSGTGDGGSGTGDGSGTGTGDGSGTGDGGSGTGTGDGNTATGSGTAADGGTGEAGEVVINAEGTPVNAITGLPNTGQGSGFQATGTAAMWLALAIAGVVAVVGAFSLRSRSQVR